MLADFDKPFLLCFSDRDPITKGGDAPFLAKVPGTHGQPHTTIDGASHFLQEDKGPELAAVLNAFIAANPAQPTLRPVSEKIGEGGTNLRDRQAALGRRRGGEKRSP